VKALHDIEKICTRLLTWPVSWWFGVGLGMAIVWLDSMFTFAALEVLTPIGQRQFSISWAIGTGYMASQIDTQGNWHPDFGKPKSKGRRWIERGSLVICVLGCAIAFAFFGRRLSM
jgi:hypothetical protein